MFSIVVFDGSANSSHNTPARHSLCCASTAIARAETAAVVAVCAGTTRAAVGTCAGTKAGAAGSVLSASTVCGAIHARPIRAATTA